MKLKPLILRIKEEPIYFLKFLKKNFLYKFSRLSKSPLYPRSISIIPTYRCDFSCLMCGNPKVVDTKSDDNQVDLQIYKKLIDEIAKYTPNIVLTGGEPLLYDKWYELSKYIKSKNLRLDLQTNGWKLEEEAEKVVEVIDNLNISIDGTEEIHDKIRRQGSFEKIIQGLKKINKIKKEKKKKKPYIVIVYTISDVNYEYLQKTIKYLNALNITIDTFLFIHQMFIRKNIKDEYLSHYGSIFKITDVFSGFTYIPENIDTKKLSHEIENVKSLSKKMFSNINFWPDLKGDDIKIYYEDVDKFPSVAPATCATPFTEAFVLPSGDVWICPLNIVGNIKEESFISLWTGEKAKRFREEIIKVGKFKICKNCCGGYNHFL